MNRNGIRIAACAIAGTIAFSGYHTSTYAKANLTKVLPAAGIAVVLEEGNTIQELTKEVIENIAYLESASGLQPNILIATEQVPLAEKVENISILNATTLLTDVTLVNTSKEVNEDFMKSVVEVKDNSAKEKVNKETDDISTDNKQGLITDLVSNVQKKEEAESTSESETIEESSQTQEAETAIDDTETEISTEEASETSEEETEETSAEEASEELDSSEEETSGSQPEEEDFSGLVIAKVNRYVNVRSIPSEEGEIVGKLYDKSVGDLIEEVDGWYKITSGECTGYVKGLYCVTGEEAQKLAKEVGTTYAVVNTGVLNVREQADTASDILGKVPKDEELVVVEDLGDWVKIAIEEGDGYVSKDYVDLKTEFVHAESKAEEEERLAKEEKEREEARKAVQEKEQAEMEKAQEEQAQENNEQIEADTQTEETTVQENEVQAVETDTTEPQPEQVQQPVIDTSSSSAIGNAVIDYAKQFVGNPYVYGGSSLTNGTDCSGFVMRVYENFGVNLPHSSSALRSNGYDVGGLENAQPGDIVCYSGHVGLYVGNGQIVHASTSKTGIIVSNANYRQILTVRRIF